MAELTRHMMIKESIVISTGPGRLTDLMEGEKISEHKFFSFIYYELSEAFIPGSNDLSWTERGEKKISEDKEQMEKAATTIQTFYRFFQAAPKIPSTKSLKTNEQEVKPSKR